jgi:hypothetical protein
MNNDNDKIDNLCNIIMRQTNYTKEECITKLKLHNNNIINIISEYIGIEKKNTKKNTTTNQMIYNEFRTFLDDASNKYRYKKEFINTINENKEKFLNNSNNIVDNSNIIIDNE